MNADVVYCDPLDDSFQACNYMLHWPDFFQLSCYGVFCQCGKFPGEMESRPLYVQHLIALIRTLDNIIDMYSWFNSFCRVLIRSWPLYVILHAGRTSYL